MKTFSPTLVALLTSLAFSAVTHASPLKVGDEVIYKINPSCRNAFVTTVMSDGQVAYEGIYDNRVCQQVVDAQTLAKRLSGPAYGLAVGDLVLRPDNPVCEGATVVGLYEDNWVAVQGVYQGKPCFEFQKANAYVKSIGSSAYGLNVGDNILDGKSVNNSCHEARITGLYESGLVSYRGIYHGNKICTGTNRADQLQKRIGTEAYGFSVGEKVSDRNSSCANARITALYASRMATYRGTYNGAPCFGTADVSNLVHAVNHGSCSNNTETESSPATISAQ